MRDEEPTDGTIVPIVTLLKVPADWATILKLKNNNTIPIINFFMTNKFLIKYYVNN
jgi:hypothetical protein